MDVLVVAASAEGALASQSVRFLARGSAIRHTAVGKREQEVLRISHTIAIVIPTYKAAALSSGHLVRACYVALGGRLSAAGR
jgi:hypothetical protein